LSSEHSAATLIERCAKCKNGERRRRSLWQHVFAARVNHSSQPYGQTPELREVCVMVLDIRNIDHSPRHAGASVLYLNMLWSFMCAPSTSTCIVNKFLATDSRHLWRAAHDRTRLRRRVAASGASSMNGTARCRGACRPRRSASRSCGGAIVGSIGSADRKEYTVIGDVVKCRFRIEALNKDSSQSSDLRTGAAAWLASTTPPRVFHPSRSAAEVRSSNSFGSHENFGYLRTHG